MPFFFFLSAFVVHQLFELLDGKSHEERESYVVGPQGT